MPYLDAISYGANGSGSSDSLVIEKNRRAFQNLFDKIPTLPRGSIVWTPSGDYVIGPPGLVVPENSQKAVIWQGAGGEKYLSPGAQTRIRASGTFDLLTASGTGTGSGQQNNGLAIRDIELHGGGFGGTVVRLLRCADVRFEHVRVRGTTGRGLWASQLWNSTFAWLRVSDCGGVGADAVKIDHATAPDGDSNTVLFISPQLEGNLGIDLNLDGSATRPTNKVVVMCGKNERSAIGSIRFGRAVLNSVSGMHFYTNSVGSCVVADTGSGMNLLIGNTFQSSNPALTDYLIDLLGGAGIIVMGNAFEGGLEAHVHLASGYGRADVAFNTHNTLTTELDILDQRTTKSGIISTRDQIRAFGGITTKIKSGVVSDSDFAATPLGGTIAVDETNNRLYVRMSNGTWRYASLT